MGRRRRGGGEGEEEPLVPDGGSGTVVVGFGGESTAGIDPEYGVGAEVAGAPVNVLQVLGGDDGYVEEEWRR